MKRLFLFMATLLAFVGCSHEEDLIPNNSSRHFTASFEDATTRTYLDDNFKLLWTADDRLTIFTSTLNEQYKFAGNTGDNSGKFTKIATDDFSTGNTISTNYAVYPYSDSNALSNDEVITLTLPAVQSYAEDSFGLGANTMVAVTADPSDTFLPFKNLGGYLRLQLYGEGITVKSITLQGNNSEPLAGEASVVAIYGSLPELTLTEGGATSIRLDCGEGVALGATADEATAFWFVAPPTTFEGGFSITITDTEGKTMTKSTTKEFSIVRNTFKTMNAFEVVTTIPSTIAAANEIIYTSTDDAVVTPFATDVFGANITSNVYEDGVGVITFDGTVTKIGAEAFKDCTTLESVILPNGEAVITRSETTTEGITSIDENAFSGCTNLTSVAIPEGVTTIGNNAFNGCSNLTDVEIPESVTTIGNYAFNGCSSLDEVPTTPNITAIAAYAFADCTSITEYTIPEGVTSIEMYAFKGCTNLTSVSIPESVTSIGLGAFEDCKALTSINIPENVTSISDYTFKECSSLESINVPESVTSIGSSAFNGCKALTSIAIPESVTSIGSSAFYGCSSLTSITIPKDITSIEQELFYGCSSLTSINIPEGVTSIGNSAFYDCPSLESITIPNSVTSIGRFTFCYCSSLKSITIPESVTSIGDAAFGSCI